MAAPSVTGASSSGLRGLAVASVVVYHAWPSALPGGWIGVSVFFTLSGFLITTIVARDHELTRSSLGDFWRRRARRLLRCRTRRILLWWACRLLQGRRARCLLGQPAR